MVGRHTRDCLARIAAVAIWADERLEPEEIESSRDLARTLEIGWKGFHGALLEEIESLVSDLSRAGDSIQELIGPIYLEEGVDPLVVLDCIAGIIVSDNRVTFRELEVLHQIAESLRIPPVLVSQAIVSKLVPKMEALRQRGN